MRFKLKVFFALLLILINLGCERDEICLEEITPKLILRFYNENNPNELKRVQALIVNIEGIEGDYEDESLTVLTDSIAVPLRVTENSTKIILNLSGDTEDEDNLDTLSVTYSQEDIFISRACGYKTIYNEAQATLIDDPDNWIKGIEIKNEPLQIIDETKAHVKIYH
ncbi:MAG: hypothetical protein JSV73_11135 [Flavobacteriaceae bacterium]|nr:MAG: hypothetical protein JSV73_11135 [Flavobacteriaceae bacterium]